MSSASVSSPATNQHVSVASPRACYLPGSIVAGSAPGTDTSSSSPNSFLSLALSEQDSLASGNMSHARQQELFSMAMLSSFDGSELLGLGSCDQDINVDMGVDCRCYSPTYGDIISPEPSSKYLNNNQPEQASNQIPPRVSSGQPASENHQFAFGNASSNAIKESNSTASSAVSSKSSKNNSVNSPSNVANIAYRQNQANVSSDGQSFSVNRTPSHLASPMLPSPSTVSASPFTYLSATPNHFQPNLAVDSNNNAIDSSLHRLTIASPVIEKQTFTTTSGTAYFPSMVRNL
jgi:hypothetical protein